MKPVHKLRRILTVITSMAVVVLTLLAMPLAVEGQQAGKVHRIGWLGSSVHVELWGKPFLDELRNLGWVEGQHFVIEYRILPSDRFQRLPTLATELVDLKVDLIFSVLTPSTRAATEATSTIPIVFTIVADPVGSGFVESLARPGRNVTGVSNSLLEIDGKVVELLKEAVPGASRVAYLWNAGYGRLGYRMLEKMHSAADALGVSLQSVEVRRDEDIVPALEAMSRERPEALIVLGEPLTTRHRTRIVEFTLAHRLPFMAFSTRAWAEAGALMSYAPVYPAQFRRAAHLVSKILRGANPADLPVELPTEFDLALNLKTARAFGLTISPSVLVRADHVIE